VELRRVGCQSAGREEQRIARQKGGYYHPGFQKNYHYENHIGPYTIMIQHHLEMGIQVQKKIDQCVHALLCQVSLEG
jgi:hypothetical protein